MIKTLHFFLILCLSVQLFSQDERVILWSEDIKTIQQDSFVTVLNFEQSIKHALIGDNRIYFEKIPTQCTECDIELVDLHYLDVSDSELTKISKENLSDTVKYDYFIGTERKNNYLFFYLEPFRIINNTVQKLSHFKIKINEQELVFNSQKKTLISNSILSTGNWFKIGVTQTGLHKLDSDFLNSMGVDIASISPKNIRIYGNKAGMLSEGGEAEIDDLQELSISVIGEDDGVFDDDDFILFYGQSPHVWEYEDNEFVHQKNIYSSKTYYFICFDLGPGKRIESIPAGTDIFDNVVSSYDAYFFYEKDKFNLVNTGRQWFGASFMHDSNQNFNIPIDHWHTNDVLFRTRVAATSSSSFSITSGSNYIGLIEISNPESGAYYKAEEEIITCQLSGTNSSINFNYNNDNTSADAWLDYFTIQGRADIIYDNTGQLLFRDTQSVGPDFVTNFRISSPESVILTWDVTDPLNVINIPLVENNQEFYFQTSTTNLKEFLVFNDTYQDAITPQFIASVPNQNIRGFDYPSYIIVTHPDFIEPANRLADYHRTQNNENVLVATTQQVYNEFSTGSQDISAIRNLVKMFYDRAEKDKIPKNLLLFGDASFDYKNNLYNNSNFVPTYQSFESSNIEDSYCTDDYFGVLEDDEGLWNDGKIRLSQENDLIDIGIGRIPASSVIDAEGFVDKVLTYHDINSRGDWKNKVCIVADDIDQSWEYILIKDAEELATDLESLCPQFNINKIYLDSYSQITASGSQRYPDAQNDLRTQINEGALIVTYFGHGGEIGLASERVLELSDINGFSNINNLPVFVTATCEFTRYDDPTRISAGEHLILNPNGGAIGLYSTSRTVLAGPAGSLAKSLHNYLPDKTQDYTFGESMFRAKNAIGTNSVGRKFLFFGDPNLKLPHPEFTVNTTSIVLLDSLGQEIVSNTNGVNDTIKALSYVRIYGEVIDDNNSVIDFSGDLYATIFDKKSLFITLNNDGAHEPVDYEMQKNIIYKGAVNVFNGYFTLDFIVPKDISYQYGPGKLSYYATDTILGEAAGFYNNMRVGGMSNDFAFDSSGPEINLFMNDTHFVSGGYTNTDPELLALLFDESGINTIGTAIGHDLTAVLDEDISNQYILNNYYEADFNTFQSGKVRYPFYDLPEGTHVLQLKAWDVHNNSSTAQIEFLVTSSTELAIEYLLNYPNPSSSFTRFAFEHNRPNEELDIRLDIFSISGDLVKTISGTIFTTGFREESISWNIDSSIDPGIYIYRLWVQSQNDETISQKTEKLIIVR